MVQHLKDLSKLSGAMNAYPRLRAIFLMVEFSGSPMQNGQAEDFGQKSDPECLHPCNATKIPRILGAPEGMAMP